MPTGATPQARRWWRACGAIAVGFVTLLATACDRPAKPAATPTTNASAAPVTVASLVPAASDLILGMGAGDRLVAVSNYDQPDERTKHLPRVGDYQNFDWEKLAAIRPNAMVVQFEPNRIPPGLQQRADALRITIVNTSNDRLADVFTTMRQLGEALKFPTDAAAKHLQDQLDRVAASVAGKPRVRTLLVMDDAAQYAVGADTFLGDLLAIAGGENVLANAPNRYVQIDREQLLALQPTVILQLRPGASPHEVDKARQTMAALTQLTAVRDGRVYIVTEPWALIPGYRVGDLAERFAMLLHGEPSTTAPTTTTAATTKAAQ